MRKGKMMGKIFGMAFIFLLIGAVLATVLPLGTLDKNQVSAQEGVSYIIVHALNPEGIEIGSIEGMELYVPAQELGGITFTVTDEGVYRFTITAGAYSPWPCDATFPEPFCGDPGSVPCWGWKTIIGGYIDRSPWSSCPPDDCPFESPSLADFSVGDPCYWTSSQQAEAVGKGMFIDVALKANQEVTLLAPDHKGFYGSNNRGGVYLSIVQVGGENQPPVASFTYSPENPIVGEEITFDASSSYDPDGEIVTYSWDFGDGNTIAIEDKVMTHVYAEAGNYAIMLTVTDDGGLTASISEVIGIALLPTVEITEARMVSPSILGIDATVWFPDSDPEEGPRYVELRATINGQSVREQINVTGSVRPGETEAIEWANTKLLQIDLANTHDEDDNSVVVPRFSKNEEFNLTAVAWSPSSGRSEVAEKGVEIRLPVIILHGYVHPWGYPVLSEVPILYWIGKSISYDIAYKGLSEFLQDRNYSKNKEYRTLWDPWNWTYTDPNKATSDTILRDLDSLFRKVEKYSYAQKANLIGHSFGGLVAGYYASVRPERVNIAITAGTPHEGTTRFFTILFSDYASKEKADKKFEISKHGESIILWTVPKYECLKDRSGNWIQKPYESTFNYGPAPGVTYYSFYSMSHSTEEWLFLDRVEGKKDGTWYKIAMNGEIPLATYSFGDDYMLADSAKAFGIPMLITEPYNSEHALLLNNQQLQNEVNIILSD